MIGLMKKRETHKEHGAVSQDVATEVATGDKSTKDLLPYPDESHQISRLKKALSAGNLRRIVPLSGDDLLVETLPGFYMVVPAWNLDVAVGIVRDGMIEPWTNEIFRSLISSGSRVINVGPNFGYYSIMAAQRVGGTGRVYAIEANPHVFPYLVKSSYYAGVVGILRCFNCAAVAPEHHGQQLEFEFDPQFMGGGNLFAKAPTTMETVDECLWTGDNMHMVLDANCEFQPKGICRRIQTTGRTVDSLVESDEQFDAMIIDAEGSESFVIAGTREAIDRSPNLRIVMEWDPYSYQDESRRPHIDRMWDFLLDDQNYSAYRICHEGYRGYGHLPTTSKLNRETLFQVPHSDLLLVRDR